MERLLVTTVGLAAWCGLAVVFTPLAAMVSRRRRRSPERAARRALESHPGPFRDWNGGLWRSEGGEVWRSSDGGASWERA